ncbi:hypothetical protein FHY02_004087 [Sphingomonas sp. BK069]|jgi:hypothetical protein|nr:hypothetical protein [Sphingomonas sp. BK069]
MLRHDAGPGRAGLSYMPSFRLCSVTEVRHGT